MVLFLSISVILGSVMGLKASDSKINWFMGCLWLPWCGLWVDAINKKSVEIALQSTVETFGFDYGVSSLQIIKKTGLYVSYSYLVLLFDFTSCCCPALPKNQML